MTNLTDKFSVTNEKIDSGNAAILAKLETLRNEQSSIANALATQLAQQHTALMTLLSTIDSNIQIIAESSTITRPDPTILLADIIKELKDIHLDTQSLDIKLLRIRDAISPIGEAFPTGARTGLLWSLYRIATATAPPYPAPSYYPDIQTMLLRLYDSPTISEDFINAIGGITQRIGDVTGDATSTILGLLSSIQFSNTSINASIGPISGGGQTVRDLLAAQADAGGCGCTTAPPPAGSCDDLYISVDMQFVPTSLVPGLTSVVYALWPEPAPAGLQFGSIFGSGLTDNSTIKPAFGNSWTGYRLFVRSSAPSYSTAFTSAIRYPTGEWRDLSGSAEIGVIVPGGESVEAYLCLGPVLIDNCIEISSQLVTIGPRDGTKSAAHMAGPPPGFSGSNTVLLVPFPPAYSLDSPVVWQGNFNGWTFQTLTGTDAVIVAAQPSDGTESTILIVPPGEIRTITEPTSSVWVTRSVISGAPDGAFTIRACPPGAGGPA